MAPPRKPIIAGAYVDTGPKVQWDNAKLSMAALKPWVGQRVTITIAPEIQKRSLRANAYLWGVVYKLGVEVLREAGYTTLTAYQLHELMKDRHNAETVVDPFTGEEKRIVKSTRDLPVDEFGVFIESVMVDLAELCGISFPEPRRHEDWRSDEAAA